MGGDGLETHDLAGHEDDPAFSSDSSTLPTDIIVSPLPSFGVLTGASFRVLTGATSRPGV